MNVIPEEDLVKIPNYDLNRAVERAYLESADTETGQMDESILDQQLAGENKYYSEYDYERAMDKYLHRNSIFSDELANENLTHPFPYSPKERIEELFEFFTSENDAYEKSSLYLDLIVSSNCSLRVKFT